MVRLYPAYRLLLLLIASWSIMVTSHEAGHLLGGWVSGATLRDYRLAPWTLPYSLHDPNPCPQCTLWAGPLVGTVAPLAVAVLIRHPVCWFMANFCVLANGCYLALAWLSRDRWLDTQRLLDAGASPLCIALFIAVTLGYGYFAFRRDCVYWLSRSNQPRA